MFNINERCNYPEVYTLNNEEIVSCIYYALEEAKFENKIIQRIEVNREEGFIIETMKVLQ